MLEYFTLILLCQLAGEFAVGALDAPVPGPVLGMVFLFAYLVVKGSIPQELADVASTLLGNLSLMFVPAGVGVMVHFKLLGSDALPISVALVLSTLLTVAITAVIMSKLNAATNAATTGGATQSSLGAESGTGIDTSADANPDEKSDERVIRDLGIPQC